LKKTVAITGVWILLLAIVPAFAQSKKDPLTDQQIEDVREAGDQPLERIKLFVGYVDERAKGIHSVNADPIAQNKNLRLHNLFQEFTQLCDELQDNMDNFDQEHADLRKELKEVVDKTTEWAKILNEPKPSTQYDFTRKTAIDSNQSAHESATQMMADETKYFADLKKKEKEQEKEEQKR
jgi:DNA-binding ferritin-like protein